MRGELGNLAVEMKRALAGFKQEAAILTPAGEPLEEFEVGQDERVLAIGLAGVGFGEPLDEFPVGGLEQFLFVGGAGGEFYDFQERLEFFAGAGAEQVKLDAEAMPRGLVVIGLDAADDAEGGARRIEVAQGGREKPMLELLHELPFLLGFLDLGKMVEIGVRKEFGGERAAGTNEEEGELLEAFFVEDGHQLRPPVVAVEIAAGKGEFFEIILEQQPGALGIGAGGELGEDFGALGDGFAGIGEFAAEVGEGAVRFREHPMVRIVLGCDGRTLPVAVSKRNSCHRISP
jgi:hypothetical protein